MLLKIARACFLLKQNTSFKVSISSCFLTGLLDYLSLVSRNKIDSEVIFALKKERKRKRFVTDISLLEKFEKIVLPILI